jgi:hypothetical protein
VVVNGEQQGLLGGGGPPLVDGAHLFPSSEYPFACAVDED